MGGTFNGYNSSIFSKPNFGDAPSEVNMLTSWLPDEPEPIKPTGMVATQKERIGKYMDEFKTKNGGCLLADADTKPADAKIVEYSAYPEVCADAVRIYLYGLSKDQARKFNSDELAEAKLFEQSRSETEVSPENAKVVVITLDKDSETRKYY